MAPKERVGFASELCRRDGTVLNASHHFGRIICVDTKFHNFWYSSHQTNMSSAWEPFQFHQDGNVYSIRTTLY